MPSADHARPNPTARRRPPRRRRALALAGACGIGLTLAACGNKEPPKPPQQLIPAPTTDLEVSQRGLELQFSFTYPATTTAGLTLPELMTIELWRMAKPLRPESAEAEEEAPEDEAAAAEPVPEAAPEQETPAAAPFLLRRPAATPELPAEQQVQVDPREFAALAAIALRIEGAELDAAVSGDRVLLRLPLEEPAAVDDAQEVLIWAVTSTSSKKLGSGFSNLVKILPRPPPPAPTPLQVEPAGGGIEVTWQADDPPIGFRVYRRDAASRAYGAPIAELEPASRRYLDGRAAFGSRYVYAVTSVGVEQPLLESALSAEREVDYQDRYAPPPPANLVILPEPGRARLLWEPSEADDLAGYRVFRRAAGESGFSPLTDEPTLELEYLDDGVSSGRRYSYYVTAVDLSGNESEAGATADVVIP